MTLLRVFYFSFLLVITSCNDAVKNPSAEINRPVKEKQILQESAKPIKKTVAIIKIGFF
jgi:hypothetical protein